MTIKIDRFESKPVNTGKSIRMNTSKSVAIKDHVTDELIVLVSFYKTHDKNTELADKFIKIIEDELNDKND